MQRTESSSTASLVRIRTVLDDNFALVVAALTVLALAGGFLTYATHVDPGTTVETRAVDSWESTGAFSHQATVVNGTDAFERGAVLRNRSAYFVRVTPTLDGSFTYSYEASGGGDLAADASIALVTRSISESESGETTEYWRVERPIRDDEVDSLEPGERVEVPFSVNVPAASDRAEQIEGQHGATPGQTRLSLVARVDLAGTRNGERVERTRRYRLPVSLEGGVYSVEDPGAVTESGSTTERATVPRTYGPARELGGPLLLGASLALLGATGLARRRGALAVSDRERAAVAYRRERAEYDDWITMGRVPSATRPRSWVEVDSLEGLVDVAIDTDARVIEDKERGEYVVLGEATTYVYEPPITSRGSDAPGGEIQPVTAGRDSARNGDQPEPVSDADEGQAPGEGGQLD